MRNILLIAIGALMVWGCTTPVYVTKPNDLERFVTHPNGTVVDEKTGLMWASNDSNYDLNYEEAKQYSKNSRLAGYTDWRLPTTNELIGLYSAGIRKREETPNQPIGVHWRLWTSDISSIHGGLYSVDSFSFHSGVSHWIGTSTTLNLRVLIVRNVNSQKL